MICDVSFAGCKRHISSLDYTVPFKVDSLGKYKIN